ncbi:GtrA family protein [Modestobacter italicus]|uniref:GtrA family protein n=1 Tax=Modestobacter italicus (strain DSM 44449 / CECT 9708 / BC 501) TaxID=2732864 RepID=UPI001C979183|nr:GtrA family protein [Modestobacter italicus]
MSTSAARPPGEQRATAAQTLARSRSDLLRAEFPRFVAVGLVSSAVYGVIFMLLSSFTDAPHLVVNVVATADSAVLGNELHRRFTFRAGTPASVARGQATGLGMAAVGLVMSSLALTGWQWVAPDAGDVSSLLIAYGTNGLVGLANFATQHTVLRPRARPSGGR